MLTRREEITFYIFIVINIINYACFVHNNVVSLSFTIAFTIAINANLTFY